MADEDTQNLMKITVKTATKKDVVEVSEDATVKEVKFRNFHRFSVKNPKQVLDFSCLSV